MFGSQMRPLILALACTFLPLQTLYYVDCCCGDFCTHKNACSGCGWDQSKPCEMAPNHLPGGDCCPDQDHSAGPSDHQHKKACAHVSPSSEVTVETVAAAPPVCADLLLLVLPTITQPEPIRARDTLLEQVSRTRSDVPRHLLLSVLLI